ncbi:diguanylate cyclase (GGDEF)-like protein [Chromobacterium alkanivorans]|uniref:GGDEF domain-containing protein n=1 Tax=Chromobacterium alkanivorans TaxID=1071719 RepID=UPI0021694262|nr:sensor domain-containing diguanylate cyclase [Chromobacterium alkanivorans]MCS3805064.1 diguanylate cyclase (GGDEF)-like protein [Chromobacterium alkanivorans]MCS3819373.1 diguanylate cyclase (GGDEF)-like protein [Chromobacterium alkanivorans]MCS3873885.1 diguanylate cyclase (GGDEF)-like protein [Chromobacterium alkanivorans]
MTFRIGDEAVDVGKEVLSRSLDFVPIPILISESDAKLDQPGRRVHRYLNRAFLQQIGYTLEQMPDMEAWFRLAYPDPVYRLEVEQSWLQAVKDSLALGRNLAEMTVRVCCADGRLRWFIVTAQLHADLLPNWHIVTFRDVDDLKCMMDENARLSRTDFLTGLINRREAVRQLESAWLQWLQTRRPFAVLLCDIDHFKLVNDRFGHDGGDYVLVEAARLLREAFPDLLCSRWGGEEFLLLAPDADGAEAEVLAERARQRLAGAQLQWQQQPVPLTLSIGHVCAQPGLEVEALLQRADAALYLAKAAGRNCCRAG